MYTVHRIKGTPGPFADAISFPNRRKLDDVMSVMDISIPKPTRAIRMVASPHPSMPNDDGLSDDHVRDGILEACNEALIPFIQLLLRHGMAYEEFAIAAKGAFVRAMDAEAQRERGVRHSPDVKTSLMTGLTFEEIQEIRHGGFSGARQVRLRAATSQVLSAWHGDPDYTGPYGMPLELQFDSDAMSFTKLVQKNTEDFDASEVLTELVQAGCVETTDKGELKVANRAYISHPMDGQTLLQAGRTLRLMGETLVHNLMLSDGEEKKTERKVWTEDGIRAEDLPGFEAIVKEATQTLLEDLDNWIVSREMMARKDSHAVEGVERVFPGVGVYLYRDFDKEKRVERARIQNGKSKI